MKKTISIHCIAVMMLMLTAGCANTPEKAADEVNLKVVNVQTETAKMVVVEDVVELSAVLQPVNDAFLSFEVPGRIISIGKKEGDDADAGDVMAKIDASQYEINTGIADASLVQAGANLDQAVNGAREQEKESAKATYDKASAVYQKALEDFKRVENLLKEGVVTQSDYENAQTRLTAARNDMIAAKAGYDMALEGARTEVKQMAEAGYRLAEGNSSQAKLALERTQLKAPFKGTILAKTASEGQLVAAGTTVFRFGDIDTLKLVLPVPDNSIDSWNKGDKVAVSLYGKEKQGTVTNIFPATNVMTGTIGVEVRVPNDRHDWVSGQIAVCRHITRSRESIFLPVESIISMSGKEPYVFINIAGKAVKKEIKTGEIKDNRIQILSGLDDGMEVVVKGASDLFDGAGIKATGGGGQ